MERLSDWLAASGLRLYYWCPACDVLHSACAVRQEWDRKSVSPTLRMPVRHHVMSGSMRETLCHYALTAGYMNYYDDCPHNKAGQSVKLPKLPNWVGD